MSTMTSSARPTTGSPFTRLLRRFPLLAFFVLTLGLTWPLMIVDALGSRGLLPFRLPIVPYLLMGYGPTVAALIMTGATNGKTGVRSLLSQLLAWRVGLQWYALAIFGPAVLFFLSLQLYTVLGGTPLTWPTLPFGLIPSVLLLFLVSMLINGEELGWRGYALPRLQANRSALAASLILGGIWALFHLPLFWTLGSTQASEPSLGFLVRVLAAAVLMTWLYNNTRGSVLLAILYHAAANTWSQIFPGIDTAQYPAGPVYWLLVGLTCLVALIVVLLCGPAHLSRTRHRVSQPGGWHAPETAPVQA